MADLLTMLTTEQQQRLADDPAWKNPHRPMGFPLGATTFQYAGHLQQLWGLATPEEPVWPTVTERQDRLQLIFDRFLKVLEANGFELAGNDLVGDPVAGLALALRHVEGSRYNVADTALALAKLNYESCALAVEFGIPMHFADYELYCANLSKHGSKEQVEPNMPRVLLAYVDKEI